MSWLKYVCFIQIKYCFFNFFCIGTHVGLCLKPGPCYENVWKSLLQGSTVLPHDCQVVLIDTVRVVLWDRGTEASQPTQGKTQAQGAQPPGSMLSSLCVPPAIPACPLELESLWAKPADIRLQGGTLPPQLSGLGIPALSLEFPSLSIQACGRTSSCAFNLAKSSTQNTLRIAPNADFSVT